MDWKPDICVYHGGCDDGFGAAYVVWKKWGDAVAFVPAGHGRPIDWKLYLDGANILFVDFSLKREQMIELANGTLAGKVPASVVVLDHHKTAEAELKQWDIGSVSVESLSRAQDNIALAQMEQAYPIVAHFDMSKSGARLAWDFCFPGKSVPWLIQHIEDRDLWRFALAETPCVSAALRTYPQDFETWDGLLTGALKKEGESILRGHRKNIESFCKEAYDADIGGFKVPVVNVPYHYASDTANALLSHFPEAPFAACWFRRGDGAVQFSLRSEDSRQDVSEVAKKFGGGGHRNAAGFSMQSTGPFA